MTDKTAYDKTDYVCTLPKKLQENIRMKLVKAGLTNKEISDAMDSKVVDLEDTISL